MRLGVRVNPISSIFYSEKRKEDVRSLIRSFRFQKIDCVEYLTPGTLVLFDKFGRILEIEQRKSVSRCV